MSRRAIRRRLGPGARNTFWHETGRKGESGSNRLWKGRGPCGNASTSRFGGRGQDQGFAGGDAGVAEILGDSHMHLHGMKERSSAVQERYERQSHGSVPIRLTANLLGQTLLQEFE